jgi:glycosyltransferase involved in cell wall biosynthesis
VHNKTLLYIELPPPIHGVTYINKIVHDSLKGNSSYVFFDTNFTIDVNEVSKKSFRKAFKNIFIMLMAWRVFFQINPKSVYSVVSATKYGIIRDFAILAPALLFKKRLIFHLHGFTFYKIYQNSILYKYFFDLLSKNAVIIVLCNNQKNQTSVVMSKNSVVLHNCINRSAVVKKKVKSNILQICYVSNISREKGTLDLIKAVQGRRNVRLTIAGSFLSDKEDFLELVDQSENISYVGFASEDMKREIFESSDVFCLPSKLEEGSPVSIIEAMSYGLPIIASNRGCIADMIDGLGYILPKDYNSSDIIDGIEFIKSKYDILSANAMKKYQQNYSQEKFIRNLEVIINQEVENV